MAERLNSVIRVLEQGGTALASFASPDIGTATEMANADYDGVVYEMEHNPYDNGQLRHALQYMLNRSQIAKSGSIVSRPTPLVRIPPNGGEMSQWHAKQVLDSGVYGVLWPHVSTVEEAYNAVAACRYPRPEDAPRLEPRGIRGDAPGTAARYWGLTQQEYYQRADVWPLNPDGEILAMIMCEDARAIDNLPQMLKQVPGIGVVVIGEGDLSQNLGYPRQYEHPVVREAMATILRTCQEAGVACGHPHVDTANVAWVVEQGFRFLMAAPTRSYAALSEAKRLTGRA
ncbi:MAG: aldolase [Dehalococcoidia bacterium]|nr:MAG: aldolase [Dehalococcoidia bacterium]